jgi:NTE family protein
LRALADLMPARSPNPFPVIAGTSAGAINATELAIHAERFRIAALNLERVWRNFEVGQVFRADIVSMMRGGLHWMLAALSGGWLLPPPKSMFDNHPLRELLHANFDLDGIGRSIQAGHIKALAIAAAGYSTARSVSFFEGAAECQPWYRVRRSGEPTKITLDHLMASVAVPFLFPPVAMSFMAMDPCAKPHRLVQRFIWARIDCWSSARAMTRASSDVRHPAIPASDRYSATCSTLCFPMDSTRTSSG